MDLIRKRPNSIVGDHRSTLRIVSRVRSFLFQGLEDRVVPPSQAEIMIAALRAKRLPFAYMAFPTEGHGFREAVSIQRSVEAEFYFYSRIFGFAPADKLVPVDIENL